MKAFRRESVHDKLFEEASKIADNMVHEFKLYKMKAIPEHPLQWMPKAIWGPLKWKELHARALAYLPMDNEKEWFDSFVQSIPCQKCQAHFELFLKDNPPTFESRPALFVWSVKAHNYVNRALEKPELSLEEALKENSTLWK